MFQLPPLSYSYDALEPFIDKETLKVHHDGHHAAYVDHLNKALKLHPELLKESIDELLISLDTLPKDVQKDVRHNGGGHYNHSLMWKILCPNGNRTMSRDLEKSIRNTFGSTDVFRKKFSERAEKLFGSGYVWLCVDTSGTLVMKCLPNQDCPLSFGFTPIFLMDVWEHAYYLKHQNRRTEYIEQFWNVVDWEEVSRQFAKVEEREFRLSA